MDNIITIIQVILAIILIILILLQNRGGGIGGIFGGSDGGGTYRTKRGMEQKIFISSIIFAILFLGISLANILIRA